MFVCPHCQFENPSHNRFCQQCGNALKGLQAIILPIGLESEPQATVELDRKAEATATAATLAAERAQTTSTVAQLLTDNYQLKKHPRYQLRQPADAQISLNRDEVMLNILDGEPAADSPLIEFLDTIPDDVEENDLDAMIPPLAFPYWKLQEPLYPMVPELHAAWQTRDVAVTVLEDRSHWQTLAALANDEPVEPLEFVHWFYEMLTLWQRLAAFEAESSLLVPDNIRVDDDQVVCLQRLIFNPSDRPPGLQALGAFWQIWLPDLAAPKIAAMENLFADMAAGEAVELSVVKARLAAVAEQIQEAEVVTSPLISDTDAAAADPEPPLASLTGATAAEATPDVEEPPDLMVDDWLLPDDLDKLNDLDEAIAAEENNVGDLPTIALPMKLVRLDEVGRTHVGRQRSHNEDSFFAETQLLRTDSPVGSYLNARGLYILCDGMGGHSGGEVASHLAVKTLRDHFARGWGDTLPDDDTIKAAILHANQVIFEKNELEGRAGNARMGTTLVLMLVDGQQTLVAHVGDSRLYGLTRQGIQQVTTDHEVGQREINRGVEPAIAYARPDAYQLTQALGPRSNSEVAPTITRLTISQDTLFLLCSDGLSDNDLLETHVESHLDPLMRSKADLEEGVANLIDLANEHNGHDNITVIAVRFKLRPNLDAGTESRAI
ncbi:MAG: serine/threonine phosphatase [Leptolyngbyaceae cyanobacterium]